MISSEFHISSDTTGERLDLFLSNRLQEHSRTFIQKLIADGKVVVDGTIIRKSNHVVSTGSRISLSIPAPVAVDVSSEPIPLDILFEDDDLIVINKPAGMVVHPSAGHTGGTLVNAVLGHAPGLAAISGELRPGIVHRLDKDTSGIIVVAKNDPTHKWMVEQFKTRRVKKVYLALVDGVPPTPSGLVETAIGRDPKHRKRMAVVLASKGRLAVTEYQTINTYPLHSLIEARPLTGRTHQIRVHMAFIGCPIVGDRVYGKQKPSLNIDRHFLHASEITFQLRRDEEIQTFRAPLPVQLAKILEEITHE